MSISLDLEILILDRKPRALAMTGTEAVITLARRFGNQGSYPQTITHVGFSSDSKILVVTNVHGYLDRYVFSNDQ